jgi:hypothetical protein
MHYRLYGLSPTTGRIIQGRDITAETDAEAIVTGHGIYAETPFELWCQSRQVYSSMADKMTRTA